MWQTEQMKIKFPQSHKTEIAIGGRVLDCFATPLREAEQVMSISCWGLFCLPAGLSPSCINDLFRLMANDQRWFPAAPSEFGFNLIGRPSK